MGAGLIPENRTKMKTIEERAREWVDSQPAGSVHPYNRQAMIDAYIAAYEELTRWNGQNTIPDDDKPVIICTSPGIYYIAAYDKQFNYWFTGNGSFYRHEIIGWREIHE